MSYRRSQRQGTTNLQVKATVADDKQLAILDSYHSAPTSTKSNTVAALTLSPVAKTEPLAATPGAGNSNSLPGHQSGRSKITDYHLLDQQTLNLSDNVNLSFSDRISSFSECVDLIFFYSSVKYNWYQW